MNKSTREAARTRKNKSAHITKSDATAAPGTGQSKSHALEKLTLKIPADALTLVKCFALVQGQTPENYTRAALCSCMKCDAEMFDKDSAEIIAKLEGGAK